MPDIFKNGQHVNFLVKKILLTGVLVVRNFRLLKIGVPYQSVPIYR